MPSTRLIEARLTHSVIGAFYEVYRTLGYGLLEQLYSSALTIELRRRGHLVAREVRVPVFYKGTELGWQRLDMVVDGRLVVEIKASEALPPTARRQLIAYLAATHLQVGLLLHFGPNPRFFRLIHSARGGPSLPGSSA